MSGGGRRLELATSLPTEPPVELLAVTVRPGRPLAGPAAEADARSGGVLGRILREGGFRARETDVLFLPLAPEDTPHLLAVGLGEEGPVDAERVRRAAGLTVREARERGVGSLAFALPSDADCGLEASVAAAAEGLVLGDWAYEELWGAEKRRERPRPPGRGVVLAPEVAPDGRRALEVGRIRAESQNFARELVARPGNVATPRFLASRALALGEETGLEVEVWGPDRLRMEGFGALLAVSRGSREEPRFIQLRHDGGQEGPVVLVGKGVTFDSGGISIKPSRGMEAMKYDMAGGAAVLGAMRAIALLKLPLRVVGLVPAAENLPSGSALKPGDVIRGVTGTSIEVVNTDAEGRLLLSDALAHGARMGPEVMLDLATLTGACVVALGRQAAGLMTGDDALADSLEAAGRRSGERVWRLPLWREYRRQLETSVADLKNSGGRDAGAVTAAVFLKEFVGSVPWVHLDIAGVAWAEEAAPYQPEGATGFGVRLILEWLRSRS